MVIFVCTANRCRSILSEFLFRHYLQEGLFGPWDGSLKVASAGIVTGEYWEFLQTFVDKRYCNVNKYSFYNVPPYRETVHCLLERGWDVSGYRSVALTDRLVARARLIVTMEAGQKEAVLDSFSQSAGKTLTFKEFVGGIESAIYEDNLLRPEYDPTDPHCVYYSQPYVNANYLAIEKGIRKGAMQIAAHLAKRG